MGGLGRSGDGEVPGPVDLGHQAPGLHGLVRLSMRGEPLGDDPVGSCELGVHLPEPVGVVQQQVRAGFCPQGLRFGGKGLGERGDRWERLVVGDDELGSILGEVSRLGDHHCHRVADHSDLVDRDRPVERGEQSGRHQQWREGVGEAGHVGPGEHGNHAGCL